MSVTYHWTFGVPSQNLGNASQTYERYISNATRKQHIPRQTVHMAAESDTRLVQDTETDRTFLAVLDGLSKKSLQSNFVLRCDLDWRWSGILGFFNIAPQLVEVVGRQQTGVEDQLTHPS